jgi:hypothetical protein
LLIAFSFFDGLARGSLFVNANGKSLHPAVPATGIAGAGIVRSGKDAFAAGAELAFQRSERRRRDQGKEER